MLISGSTVMLDVISFSSIFLRYKSESLHTAPMICHLSSHGSGSCWMKINIDSLRLCQLDQGELIRELGGIDSLLGTLFEESHWIHGERSDIPAAAWHLAIECWKALRDL
jgi:hypothetical protein